MSDNSVKPVSMSSTAASVAGVAASNSPNTRECKHEAGASIVTGAKKAKAVV